MDYKEKGRKERGLNKDLKVRQKKAEKKRTKNIGEEGGEGRRLGSENELRVII
jgi:hypothetical protein